jgi:hypothetical protein
MDLSDVADDMDKWQAVLNTVIGPSGSIKCGEFLA